MKWNKPLGGLIERKGDALRRAVVELNGERHGGAHVGGLVAAALALAALAPNQRRQSAKNDRGEKLR